MSVTLAIQSVTYLCSYVSPMLQSKANAIAKARPMAKAMAARFLLDTPQRMASGMASGMDEA